MLDAFEFAADLAIRAGSMLLDCYDPAGNRATFKADHSIVTDADLAADRLITSEIREHFPQDEIISEESSHCIEEINSHIWIVDPLDGTTNYSLGLPLWGISIARVEDGLPALGVIYFPLIHELYTCKRGSGAFLDHSPIKARVPSSDQPRSFFACCSRSYRRYNISIPYKPRILGSSTYTFCMVARGSALLGLDAASKIWDLAAGWLLIEEAGGVVSALEAGSPFPLKPHLDYSVTSFPILGAASREVFSFGQDKIQPKFTV